ncbi:hypothetical protein ANCDUO_00259 [Ancylostoma duodenale]|uniref:Uncharacterized protein n=1 Tax=Ancylostoma duodenale TaxID=51022 RepID=A0A0C2E1Y1_9BILA|nr:hypothetical protein ANCDUO_00259 [Ancylostoma duodenale]
MSSRSLPVSKTGARESCRLQPWLSPFIVPTPGPPRGRLSVHLPYSARWWNETEANDNKIYDNTLKPCYGLLSFVAAANSTELSGTKRREDC